MKIMKPVSLITSAIAVSALLNAASVTAGMVPLHAAYTTAISTRPSQIALSIRAAPHAPEIARAQAPG
jgi:hypothetical protein